MTIKLDFLDQRVYTTEAASVGQSVGLLPKSEALQNDANLMLMLDRLDGSTSHMIDAINRTKTKSVLEVSDQKRDDAYRSVYYCVKGYTYNSDIAIKSAAIIVMAIYDEFGLNVTTESYSQETAHIEALLVHLATEEAVAAIALLPGLAQSITNLAQSQAAFMDTYVSYESDKAQQDQYDSATVLKKDVLDILNHQLIPYLQVMNNMSATVYGDFTGQVAQIVIDTNTVVKKRNNKSDAVD